ncbi:HNH endonuclease [Carbonactinospora thermoautotrophica]|nr:HNH endonuclease [Carbonactinospora thermoautotrophica]
MVRLPAVLSALLLGLSLGLVIGTTPAQAYPPTPPDETTIRNELATLRVETPHSMTGYSRDRFPHWITQYGTCNTREVVLQRDGVDVQVGSDCYPTSGRWYSVYDQKWLYQASEVSIDHVVPLANAWRSGADLWDDARRRDFANDLASQELIAVSATSNSAKGDQSPDQWKPTNTGYWCMYARSWVHVKYKWSLAVTSSEKSALYSMLDYC